MNIKSIVHASLLTLGLITTAHADTKDATTEPAPNGIEFFTDYKTWPIIGVSHRTDNNTLRAILGNEIAIKAARSGKTKPWPEGAVLAKVVWKDRNHPQWQAATVPSEVIHTEFMVKDSKRFKSTKGWGYARWVGETLTPHGTDQSAAEGCAACHMNAKNSDFVFTVPAPLP